MDHFFPLIQSIPVTFAALLPVINPIGTAVILLSLTEGASDKDLRGIAKSVGLNSILLLTILLLCGSYVLSFFGISVPVVQTAGGLLLAAMGWRLLNQSDAKPKSADGKFTAEPREDYASKSFYPFTFPITVGPGSVAVTLTLSAHTTRETLADTALSHAGAFVGIVGVGLVTYFCIAYSNRLASRLGPSGTSVLMRLIAFIVVCIGTQISWSGVRTLLLTLPR